jgi:hypothetical protein
MSDKKITPSKRRRRKKFGPREIAPGDLEALYEKVTWFLEGYGYSSEKWDSKNPKGWFHLLMLVARDFVSVAEKKRGPKPKWTGQLGFELVNDVEAVMLERRDRNVEAAIRYLQGTKKWKNAAQDLNKRYYDARRHWDYYRRLRRTAGLYEK